MGLQRETAGRGTTAIYTQIVFATILENVFFEYTPSPWSVAGIVMIVTAALYVAVCFFLSLTKATNTNPVV